MGCGSITNGDSAEEYGSGDMKHVPPLDEKKKLMTACIGNREGRRQIF